MKEKKKKKKILTIESVNSKNGDTLYNSELNFVFCGQIKVFHFWLTTKNLNLNSNLGKISRYQ